MIPNVSHTQLGLLCKFNETGIYLILAKHPSTYSVIRNKFYYKVKTLIPNITQLLL